MTEPFTFTRPKKTHDWSKLKAWKYLPAWAQEDLRTIDPDKYPELWAAMSSEIVSEGSWLAITRQELKRSNKPTIRPIGELLRRANKGPDAPTLMGSKKRKKLVKDVIESAKKLHTSIQILREEGMLYFDVRPSKKTIEKLVETTFAGVPSDIAVSQNPCGEQWSHGVDAVLKDPDAYLDSISEAACRWEEEIAKGAFINHRIGTDIRAVYFLRVLTKGFYSRYNTPIHAAGIELGTVFFPKYCEELDASGLGNLCPDTRKRSKAPK